MKIGVRDLALVLPIGILCGHMALFGSWIVDDAGISFAYARNLGLGFGLVAQPGVPPVEGYSNPLWVLLLAPFFAMELFDPVLIPKALALVGLAAGFVAYYSVSKADIDGGRLVAVAGLSLAGLQSGLVIWCASGLENGLYVTLLLSLAVVISAPRRERPFTSGILSAAVALTRPEGIIFALAYPICAVLNGTHGRAAASLSRYACGLVPPVSAYMLFRISYFGDILPNTYYAKGRPIPGLLLELLTVDAPVLAKARDLVTATLGATAGPYLLLLIVVGVLLARRQLRDSRLTQTILIFVGLSALTYLMLPADWMMEYRFASPFFLFFYLSVVHAAWFAMRAVVSRGNAGGLTEVGLARIRIAGFVAVVAICAGLTISLTAPRSMAFARSPTISLDEVFETVQRFERLAQAANIEHPSLLIADVGAALLLGRIRIYDLGMLTDRTIARALGEAMSRINRASFHDYIFETARPAFIATRAYHSWIARLDSDTRFRRDYVSIVEYRDEWIQKRYGVSLQSGDFIRKDALAGGGDEVLSRLRELVKGSHYVGCSVC